QLRGLALSNVQAHVVTVDTISAKTTAVALICLNPQVGSLASSATDSITNYLSRLPGFSSLVAHLANVLQTASVSQALRDGITPALIHQTIVEYGNSLAALRGASASMASPSPSFGVTRSFLDIDATRDVFVNAGIRVVAVWQRDLDANGTEQRPPQKILSAMTGQAGLSVTSLITSLFSLKNPVAPNVQTLDRQLPQNAPSKTEFWVIGAGFYPGDQPPPSINASAWDNLGASLYDYIFKPSLTLVPGKIPDYETQVAIIKMAGSIAATADLGRAIEQCSDAVCIAGAVYDAVAAIMDAMGKDAPIQALLKAQLGETLSALPDFALGSADLTAFATLITMEPRFSAYSVTAASGGASVVDGNGQTGLAGAPLPLPLKIRITAVSNQPVFGHSAYFSTPDGGHFVLSANLSASAGNPAFTDEAGTAQVYWVLGPSPGPQHASVTVPWISGSPLLFSAVAMSEQGSTVLPAAPSSLVAAASPSSVSLSWVTGSTNEDGFRIERAPGGTTTFSQIMAVGAGVVSYIDQSVTANATYVYRVRAFNSAGNSAFSNTAMASTTLPTLPAPTVTLTANPTTITAGQSTTLTWSTANATLCVASWPNNDA
ncbi:MAG: hypothetical protein ACRETL_01375, partial [Gammaproteobacteria bacterium]